MNEFLSRTFFGNTTLDYIYAILIFAISVLSISLFRFIILKRVKKLTEKTSTQIDDLILRVVEKTVVPLLYFSSLYIAVKFLDLNEQTAQIVHVSSLVVITYFLIRLFISSIKFSLHAYLKTKEEADYRQKQLNGIVTLLSFIIWGIGIVFLLDNLGFEISAVITGLGIGGIAIALAAQTILGDLFNYFVIFFDRPFEIGDFIIVDDKKGTVEYIGIKTTRVRSLSGEQIIFSNSNLTNSRVHNYKRLERRRVVFKFGIEYSTPYQQITEIPGIIRSIIEEEPDTTFDRSHFTEYADSSLMFETVYFVNSPDYNRYMDIQQNINLKMNKEFHDKEINFAYPVRTIYLHKMKEEIN